MDVSSSNPSIPSLPLAALSYLQTQSAQIPSDLLDSILDELALRSESGTLRAWCHLFGKLWADRHSEMFSGLDDLKVLTDQLNDFLAKERWGWVAIQENELGLQITHTGWPYAGPDKVEHLPWLCGLLEGFYESIFHLLGASEDLHVRVTEFDAAQFNLQLQLSE